MGLKPKTTSMKIKALFIRLDLIDFIFFFMSTGDGIPNTERLPLDQE